MQNHQCCDKLFFFFIYILSVWWSQCGFWDTHTHVFTTFKWWQDETNNSLDTLNRCIQNLLKFTWRKQSKWVFLHQFTCDVLQLFVIKLCFKDEIIFRFSRRFNCKMRLLLFISKTIFQVLQQLLQLHIWLLLNASKVMCRLPWFGLLIAVHIIVSLSCFSCFTGFTYNLLLT